MFDSILDFIVRYQFPLFFLLGLLASIPFGYRAIIELVAEPAEFHENALYNILNWKTVPRVRRCLSRPSLFLRRSLFWLSITILGTLLSLGLSKPIPSSLALSLPPLLRDERANMKLLVFIHGWNGDPSETWRYFPLLVRDDLQFASFNLLSVSYPTYQIRRNLSVSQLGGWLNQSFSESGLYSRYTAISVIAHSVGGIVARELVVQSRLSASKAPLNVLVEIGTPHEGAALAKLASTLGLSSGLVEDIAPNSPFLRDLRQHWNALAERPRTFCISSPHDSVVDDRSATAQCDRFGYYPQWSHSELVKPENRDDERYRLPMSQIAAPASLG